MPEFGSPKNPDHPPLPETPSREELYHVALEKAHSLSRDVEQLLEKEHRPIDALHVHALPKIQDEWVLARAKELVDKLDIPYVALNGDLFPQDTLVRAQMKQGKKFGQDVLRGFGAGLWSGHMKWRARLVDLGVPEEKILSVGTGEYTHSEIDNLLRVSKEKAWKRVISLSSITQLERTARTFYGSLRSRDALDPEVSGNPAFLFTGAAPADLSGVSAYASTGEEKFDVEDFFIFEQKKLEEYMRDYPEQVGSWEWLEEYRKKSKAVFGLEE